MTNVADLKAGDKKVEVEGTISQTGDIREINKYGRSLRVCTAELSDKTGKIQLSLWNDDVDKFRKGDKVRIENGYVNEWQGTAQLTTGKFGKIEKVE